MEPPVRSAPLNFDAVVIGAGPAGATSARLLAEAGWRVALVERRRPGTVKCCGHCLAASANHVARRLRIEPILERATLERLNEVRIEVPPRIAGSGPVRSVTAALPDGQDGGHGRGRLIDRRMLDALLLDLAVRSGAVLLRPARLLTLEGTCGPSRQPPEQRWTLRVREDDDHGAERTLRCGLLVGADGLGSMVARRLGWAPRRPGRAFGFSGELPAAVMPSLPPGQIRMHLVPGGYVGLVRWGDRPHDGDGRSQESGIHLGALIHEHAPQRAPMDVLRSMARVHPDAAGVVEAMGRELEERPEPIKGPPAEASAPTWAAAGPMPWRPHCVAAEGAALVGDAAGFIEPFTGEGMAWALASAALLGEAIAVRDSADRTAGPGGACFDEAAAKRYRAAWGYGVLRAHRRCAIVARMVAAPGLLRSIAAVAPGVVGAVAKGVTMKGLRLPSRSLAGACT